MAGAGWPESAIATPRSRAIDSSSRTTPDASSARSTGSGCLWSVAASAWVSSPSWPTSPDRLPAAARARSSCAASAGTTPSTMAWICDSRTVAGVARSCARSLAARRRSSSDRSRRSAIPLNASARSEDSASEPPVARAPRSPASRRRAAVVTSRSGAVTRLATSAAAPSRAATATMPVHSSAVLNARRNPALGLRTSISSDPPPTSSESAVLTSSVSAPRGSRPASASTFPLPSTTRTIPSMSIATRRISSRSPLVPRPRRMLSSTNEPARSRRSCCRGPSDSSSDRDAARLTTTPANSSTTTRTPASRTASRTASERPRIRARGPAMRRADTRRPGPSR